MASTVHDVDAILPKTPRRAFTGRILIGTVDALRSMAVGSALTVYANTDWFFLVRTPEGWTALHNLCTHRGCRLTWDEDPARQGRLVCKTDGSLFDMYGSPVKGPADMPLDVFPMERAEAGIYVRTDSLRTRLVTNADTDIFRL